MPRRSKTNTKPHLTAAVTKPAVVNNAGGLGSFEVDDWTRLARFLVLGTEKGTYYVTEQKLTADNCAAALRLINDATDGPKVVAMVVQYSQAGRTPKQDQLVFVLALAARLSTHLSVRRLAYDAVPLVCRIPTTLFQFLDFCKSIAAPKSTGWGRMQRRAIQTYYNKASVDRLALHVTKYAQRNGWCHTDVLRLSHVKASSDVRNLLFQYVTKGFEKTEERINDIAATVATPSAAAATAEDDLDGEWTVVADLDAVVAHTDEEVKAMRLLVAVEAVKKLEDAGEVAALVRKAGLVREHVPTQHLKSVLVWKALVEKMPMTAQIRNLGKLSSLGLFDDRKILRTVADRLTDPEAIRKARVHPFSVLLALKTYSSGKGFKGSLSWKVDHEIKGALDKAFHLAFKNVAPTGKRFCLALDVSGSMCCAVAGTPQITCREASAAMALVTKNTEANCETMAFTGEFVPVDLKAGMGIDEATRKVSGLRFGATDCAVPMTWAVQKKKMFDVFVVFTDSETWFGSVTPVQALKDYRRKMNADAKLVVVGMASNGFSIADPKDKGMMDMVGFDASAPEVMSAFVKGDL
eukprot:TRINITY_DN1324_c0_g1_i8.p1 TRINITY_DN1324_c0_g1~~TRINITY_DN1324_c0_g1_i8.p1  ORF type:complete len:579 (-),score=213.77 TRINITY_DN1324_c0_g1_i8:54-1790(-)